VFPKALPRVKQLSDQIERCFRNLVARYDDVGGLRSVYERIRDERSACGELLLFDIDCPADADVHIERLSRFSLWCLSGQGVPPHSIEIRLNGAPAYTLRPTFRRDLAETYGDDALLAGQAGFYGDVVMPRGIAAGQGIDIEITARFARGKQVVLDNRTLIVVEEAPLPTRQRQRSYDLEQIIDNTLAYRKNILDTPHFHPAGELPVLNLLANTGSRRYSEIARRVIGDLPSSGIFLDFGCGLRLESEIGCNVVLMDTAQVPNIDVVNTCVRLPFRSGVFDAIVAQGSFHQSPDPHRTAAEFLRILKPGGVVLIATAFVQPLHACHGQYFHMTAEALRLVLTGFEIVEEGSRPNQYPSSSLKTQVNAVLPYIKHGRWRERLERLLADLEAGASELDDDLGPIGRKISAAGVYAVARKPQDL
jgi:SAM-dependent methyltransferase